MDTEHRQDYLESINRQSAIIRSSIVLNPVENFPFLEDLQPLASNMHGLYNTDKTRSVEQMSNTKVQFAGRHRLARDSKLIYRRWATALHAEAVTLRLLSGLHAQTTMFMSISKPGDKVLLLPEIAGGHMSTKSILERLGLEIIEIEVDCENHCINLDKTLELIKNNSPDFIFIDRSEGLVYEDFSELCSATKAIKIFDASQYLSNIIAGDHPNPFDVGFDLLVSSVHKNFPGPQKALIATAKKNRLWDDLLAGVSTYVSNMHVFSTYSAGLTLSRKDWIDSYSRNMLLNTTRLDVSLNEHGIPTVSRLANAPTTHHIWVKTDNRELAFTWYRNLERNRILVNYRKLPYELGYGLRLGLSACTRLGLEQSECDSLAGLVADSIHNNRGTGTRHKVREFAEILWKRSSPTI